MAAHFLALSLFIMLLSFFIILNSLSNYNEEKAKVIQYSLTLAFSSREGELGLDPSTKDSPEESFKEGSALDKIDSLFGAQISGIEVSKNRFGTLMKITVPAEAFGRALKLAGDAGISTTIVNGVGGNFGQMLVSFLDVQSHAPYQMDMVLNTGEAQGEGGEMSDQRKADIRQTAQYAERLEELGLPNKMITAGLVPGKEGMLDLYFKRYVPLKFDPDKIYSPPKSGEQRR